MRCCAWIALLVVIGCGGAPRGSVSVEDTLVPSSDRSVVHLVEPWTFGSAQGQVIRTTHYRIYTTERDAAIMSRLPAFLESALEHYRSGLGPLPAPSIRLDTYLMDNRAQWSRVTQLLVPGNAEEYLRIERGGFAINGIGVYFDLGLYDTHAIAAHEGWHQYVQRTFRDPLPVWLDEGIASYMEGFRWAGSEPVFFPWANIERFDQLRNAEASGELMDLEVLLSATPQKLGRLDPLRPLTFYAQVWALVHFLREGDGGVHASVLRQLLQDAAAGRVRKVLSLYLGDDSVRVRMRVGDGVFRAYFGEDLDVMNASYLDFVRALVRPGARDALIRGESPMREAQEIEP